MESFFCQGKLQGGPFPVDFQYSSWGDALAVFGLDWFSSRLTAIMQYYNAIMLNSAPLLFSCSETPEIGVKFWAEDRKSDSVDGLKPEQTMKKTCSRTEKRWVLWDTVSLKTVWKLSSLPIFYCKTWPNLTKQRHVSVARPFVLLHTERTLIWNPAVSMPFPCILKTVYRAKPRVFQLYFHLKARCSLI